MEYIRKNGFPDLILLDVNMPDMDGFETLKQLKNEMIQGNEVPVVFLTAEDGQEQETKGLESGAMDYIKKLSSYFMKRIPGTKTYKQALYQCGNMQEIRAILGQIFRETENEA